jgi:bifunctional non-homologous end joining protein LigD
VISIDDLDGLLALVQAGVLEIHVRGSTIDHLPEANRIVFDLDPSPECGFSEVAKAAREVRERLEELNLKSFLKTTGGKGLHVVVPIAHTPWDEVKAFTKLVAQSMEAEKPSRYIATASIKARKGKIFVDYLRNSREATAICAYSTRARPGATVSVPIAWEELGTLKVANRYTVANLMKRLNAINRDPWDDIGKVKQKLPRLPGK